MVENICSVEDRIAWLDRFASDVLFQEEKRRKVLVTHVHRRLEGVLAALIFLFNLFLFALFPLYVTGWIICSLFLLVVYPLTTLIPSLARIIQKNHQQVNGNHISATETLKLLRKSEQFYHIEWSVFFINIRSSATALVILCGSNIIAALALYFMIKNEADIGIFIAIQFLLFFILYLASILLKPYSRGFDIRISGLAARISHQKPLIWLILIVMGAGGVVFALIFLAAFLSPASTAFFILEHEKIGILTFFIEFSIIFLSQFILVRYIHSLQSRRVSFQVSRSIETFVKDDVLSFVDEAGGRSFSEEDEDCLHYRRLMTSLIEAKMFRTVISSLWGLFPVYTFKPDLALILDPNLRKSLTGHMSLPGKKRP